LRVRMREYLNHCKSLIRNEYYQSQILPSMPRSLQAEAALCAQQVGNKSVGVHCVPFLCCQDDAERASFIISVTLKLKHLVCPPTESLYNTGEIADKMYLVASGLCRKATFMKRKGEYFGHEMLMKDAVRVDSASAVTYVHLMLLFKSDLAEILGDNKQLFKQTRKLIRVTTIKLTVFRVVREIGRAALTMRRADTKAHQTFRRMKENEIEAYKTYLKQRVDDVRSKKDKKELEKARLKRHIAMSEHEMSKKPIDPLQRSKMTIQFYTDVPDGSEAGTWAQKSNRERNAEKLNLIQGPEEVTEISLDEKEDKEVDYDRLEGFMSQQLDEVREQLSKEVGLKLADLRTKFLGSLSAVQREVLEEFQPKFEVLEQRFAEMDAMMHALSQSSSALVELKNSAASAKKKRRHGGE